MLNRESFARRCFKKQSLKLPHSPDVGRKLNVHKTFRSYPGASFERPMYALFASCVKDDKAFQEYTCDGAHNGLKRPPVKVFFKELYNIF